MKKLSAQDVMEAAGRGISVKENVQERLYPTRVREGIKKVDLLEKIKEQAQKLTEGGAVKIDLKRVPGDYEIWARVEVIQPRYIWGKPRVEVVMFATNLDPAPYPCYDDEDGRCVNCEGWGCWTCHMSGGY